jgi:hypothetical protein
MASERIKVFVTGGTFDKQYNGTDLPGGIGA